ncbi:hypothetical protein D3C87_779280 [compost metagenome]
MDRHENPGINPGNGPATWNRGKKHLQPRKVEDKVPQEFTSALPRERLDDSETSEAGPHGKDDRSNANRGSANRHKKR